MGCAIQKFRFILMEFLMLVFEHWQLYEQVSFFRIEFLVQWYTFSVRLTVSTQVSVFCRRFSLLVRLLDVLCNGSKQILESEVILFDEVTLKLLQIRWRLISFWFRRSDRSSNSVDCGVFSNDWICRRNREYECSAII